MHCACSRCTHSSDIRPAPRGLHAGDAEVQRLATAGAATTTGHRMLPACTVLLAAVIGRDPKLLDPRVDVMRIQPLITGQVSS